MCGALYEVMYLLSLYIEWYDFKSVVRYPLKAE